MIKRHLTADCLNLVVNDPSVYNWVKGTAEGPIDLTPIVQNTDNVLLMGEYGGVLFIKHQPGVYEAHTQVLPAGRGKWTVDMVNEALCWMFTRTDCVDIMTRIPKGNLGARALAKAINGRFEFRAENSWWMDGKLVSSDVFSLRIQDWMAKAPGLEYFGHQFHERLEDEYHRLGKDRGPNHGDDPTHDRYVGAASLMIRNGQPVKGMIFYNRWAVMAGYIPISIASLDPVVIDIQESLLAVENNDFYVLRIK